MSFVHPRWKHSGRIALLSSAACLLTFGLFVSAALPAAAASGRVSGTAETRLRIGEVVRSKDGAGSVSIHYTNGIGIGGNNTLKIWLYDGGQAFAGPAYLKGTGKTYGVASSVQANKRFRVAYQAASNPGVNRAWAGTLNY